MVYDNLKGLRSSRNHYVDPPTLLAWAFTAAVPFTKWSRDRTKALVAADAGSLKSSLLEDCSRLWKRMASVTFAVQLFLILAWVLLIRWGERSVFQKSLDQCSWGNWEKWVNLQDCIKL